MNIFTPFIRVMVVVRKNYIGKFNVELVCQHNTDFTFLPNS